MSPLKEISEPLQTKRQHVRLNLPAEVEIGNKRFTVKDLSSGGMAIRNCDDSVSVGQIISFKLYLPFKDFTLDLGLKAEVLYIDPNTNSAGCRFMDLTPHKISILNQVLQSFMDGDLVDSGDFIDTTSETNFINIRSHTKNLMGAQNNTIKKYIGYTAAFCVGIILTILLQTFLTTAKTETNIPPNQLSNPAAIELTPE